MTVFTEAEKLELDQLTQAMCLTPWCVYGVMAGRNGRAINDTLQALAQAIGNPNRGEAARAVEY